MIKFLRRLFDPRGESDREKAAATREWFEARWARTYVDANGVRWSPCPCGCGVRTQVREDGTLDTSTNEWFGRPLSEVDPVSFRAYAERQGERRVAEMMGGR